MAEMKATHVIFDMDGLLLDTESIYSEVHQDIITPFGHNFTWEIKSKLMGRTSIEVAKIMVETLQLPMTPEEFSMQEKEKATKLWPNSTVLPGVRELVTHLQLNGVPMAVATSSSKELLDLKTTNHRDLFSKFNAIVTGDHPNVKNGKPHPDLFLEAARQLDVKPSKNVLVFEDAINGVQAAHAAGMSVVAIPHVNNNNPQFKEADQIIGSMSEFDFNFWGLPVNKL